jgi:hypothetical protein
LNFGCRRRCDAIGSCAAAQHQVANGGFAGVLRDPCDTVRIRELAGLRFDRKSAGDIASHVLGRGRKAKRLLEQSRTRLGEQPCIAHGGAPQRHVPVCA